MPESDPESTEHEVVVQRGKVLVVRVKAQISAKTIRMYFVTELFELIQEDANIK